MRAVWSFWTKPFFESRKSFWVSEKHHLLSWVLSFETARKHFQKTILYTDDAGARMLVEGLRLEFNSVSTELNALTRYDSKWWAIGKIFTYREQQEPFIHIDNDVFLWKRLPVTSDMALFTQNPEPFVTGVSYYKPEEFEAELARFTGSWLPPEWKWYRLSGYPQRAECCGVFGGSHTAFIRYYANLAMKIVEHPFNQGAWLSLNDQVERNILAEQYLLSACIEYHKGLRGSPFRDLRIHYLFNSLDEALDPKKAAEIGFTHLVAGSKRNCKVADDLERRVKTDYPAQYERCLRYLRQTTD